MTVLQQLYPGIITRNIHFGDSSCPGKEAGTLLMFQQGFGECLTSKLVSSVVYHVRHRCCCCCGFFFIIMIVLIAVVVFLDDEVAW